MQLSRGASRVPKALLGMAIICVTACVSNQSDRVGGPLIVVPIVNPAKDIPPALVPYAQRLEDIMTLHGLALAPSTDPHALQLSLSYSAKDNKVGIALLQQGRPVVYSSASPGFFFSKGSEAETLDAVVAKVAGNFDDQLKRFMREASVRRTPASGAETAADESAQSGDQAGTPSSPETIVAFGTAFATNSATTYVTARHVITEGDEIYLYCGPDKSAPATVLAVDASNDLVVLKSKLEAAAFLELAPQDSAAPGDHVFTMGFPTPDLLGISPKYTDGAVSALSGFGDTKSLMQISVPVQPGNSGGPLLDSKGRVVGVIDSQAAVKAFFDATGSLPQNVNFAVSSYYLYPLVKDIPRGASTAFAKLTPVKRVTASLCLVAMKGRAH